MQLVKMKGTRTVSALALAAACLAGMLALAACSNDTQVPSGDASAETSQQATTTRSLMLAGTQADATKGIVLTNRLGGDIDLVSVNVSDSKDEPTILSLGGLWRDGQDALLFIPESVEKNPSDLVLSIGKKDYTLHDVDFSAFDIGELCLKKKTAYLSYVDGDKEKSTLKHEQKLIAKAEAAKKKREEEAARKKAEEEAAAQAAAEAEAAAQAQAQAEAEAASYEQQYYEEPYYQEPYYQEPYYEETYYEEPVYEETTYQESPQEQPVEQDAVPQETYEETAVTIEPADGE